MCSRPRDRLAWSGQNSPEVPRTSAREQRMLALYIFQFLVSFLSIPLFSLSLLLVTYLFFFFVFFLFFFTFLETIASVWFLFDGHRLFHWQNEKPKGPLT